MRIRSVYFRRLWFVFLRKQSGEASHLCIYISIAVEALNAPFDVETNLHKGNDARTNGENARNAPSQLVLGEMRV